MPDIRLGRQTPTKGVTLSYEKTLGQEAIDLYNASGRTACRTVFQVYQLLNWRMGRAIGQLH